MPANLQTGPLQANAWCGQVNLERPQETYMWEDFAECVYAIQDGKQPNSHWPAISELTSKCVLVVEESINNGCKAVNFEA